MVIKFKKSTFHGGKQMKDFSKDLLKEKWNITDALQIEKYTRFQKLNHNPFFNSIFLFLSRL